VEALLNSVDERGFERGTIGQSAHAIIDIVADRDAILKEIAFDPRVPGEARISAFFLWAWYRQFESKGDVLRSIQRYLRRFPSTYAASVLHDLARTIREFGHFSMY
jgi:hypothetical protein